MAKKYGIKISRPGYNVNAADDENLVLSSDFVTPKIFQTMEFTSPGSQSHGLTYPPEFDVMWYDSTDLAYYHGALGIFEGMRALAAVDTSNVYSFYSGTLYIILYTDSLNE